MEKLKNNTTFFLVIIIIFIYQIINGGCYSQEVKGTVVRIRYPTNLDFIEVPHFYDPFDNYETLKGRLNKDRFYVFNLNIGFPQAIKLGPKWIQISPTDTVLINWTKKPFIQSKKDTSISHFEVLNRNLQVYPLIDIIPSANDYKFLSPQEFERRIESFYQAGIEYIKEYFVKYPHLDEFYDYYAKCDLLFKAGREINFYYNFNTEDTTKKLTYPRDFFKYNDSITKTFNRLYISEKGYDFFHDYTILLSYHKSPKGDYESKLNWIFNNTSGLVRDIVIGKTITDYQLRKFNKQYLPISLRFAEKINNDQLKNTLLLRINEMKNSQANLNKEVLNKTPNSLNDLLKNYHNKVVYVKFWATWCGPCITDSEYLYDLNEQVKNENFKVLNICISSPKLTYDKQLSSKIHFGEQLYLSDLEYNEIKKEIAVPYLPYYLLVDQKKNTMIKNAPRPIPDKNSKTNENLIKMINNMLKNCDTSTLSRLF
jgi:thiol-disulfide isomerase/thioredoxin